jgi:hypothetical protein
VELPSVHENALEAVHRVRENALEAVHRVRENALEAVHHVREKASVAVHHVRDDVHYEQAICRKKGAAWMKMCLLQICCIRIYHHKEHG